MIIGYFQRPLVAMFSLTFRLKTDIAWPATALPNLCARSTLKKIVVFVHYNSCIYPLNVISWWKSNGKSIEKLIELGN